MHVARMLLPNYSRLVLLLVVGLLALVLTPDIPPLSAQELFLETSFRDPDLPGWEVTGAACVEGGVRQLPPDGLPARGESLAVVLSARVGGVRF